MSLCKVGKVSSVSHATFISLLELRPYILWFFEGYWMILKWQSAWGLGVCIYKIQPMRTVKRRLYGMVPWSCAHCSFPCAGAGVGAVGNSGWGCGSRLGRTKPCAAGKPTPMGMPPIAPMPPIGPMVLMAPGGTGGNLAPPNISTHPRQTHLGWCRQERTETTLHHTAVFTSAVMGTNWNAAMI